MFDPTVWIMKSSRIRPESLPFQIFSPLRSTTPVHRAKKFLPNDEKREALLLPMWQFDVPQNRVSTSSSGEVVVGLSIAKTTGFAKNAWVV